MAHGTSVPLGFKLFFSTVAICAVEVSMIMDHPLRVLLELNPV
jgi:hypothetical protein